MASVSISVWFETASIIAAMVLTNVSKNYLHLTLKRFEFLTILVCGNGLTLCDTSVVLNGCGKCVYGGSESSYCVDQRCKFRKLETLFIITIV